MLHLKSFNYYLKWYDAVKRIPRPRTEPHLPSHLAFLRAMQTLGGMVFKIVLSGVACYLFWRATLNFRLSFPYSAFGYVIAVTSVVVGLGDSANDALPYYPIFDRATYGTSQWATFSDLHDMGLARASRKRWRLQRADAWQYGDLRLGRLLDGNELVLPLDYVMSHVAFFGPPRSGKSNTFVYNLLVQWARSGSTLILDPKGELYSKTGHHYKRVFRFDLKEPEKSDRWDFVKACRNPEHAYLMASIILGAGATRQGSNNEQFWEKSEVACLTAVLLHLAEVYEHPSASMICELLGNPELSIEDLSKMMARSPSRMARLNWGVFLKAKKELQGSIITGVSVSCSQFLQDKVAKVMTPLTDEERARPDAPSEIDFRLLREEGTAIFVVIPEGEAGMYKSVLATFLGLATAVLRNSDVSGEQPAVPVIMLLEEAGNIPIHGLAELLGVGRGRRIGIFLFYQNVPQVYDQYGEEKGGAVLGSIGTKVFLPGSDPATAEYASKAVGDTTVQQATVVDARGTKYDSQRSSDVQRRLKDPSEIRQLRAFTEAVAIIGTAPPVLFVYPKQCKLRPGQFFVPPEYQVPVPIPIEAACLRRHIQAGEGNVLAAFDGRSIGAEGGMAAVVAGAVVGVEANLPVNKMPVEEHRAAAVGLAAEIDTLMKQELEAVDGAGGAAQTLAGAPSEVSPASASVGAAGGLVERDGQPAADGRGVEGNEVPVDRQGGVSEAPVVAEAKSQPTPRAVRHIKRGAGRGLHGVGVTRKEESLPEQGELLMFSPEAGDLVSVESLSGDVGNQPLSKFVSSRGGAMDNLI